MRLRKQENHKFSAGNTPCENPAKDSMDFYEKFFALKLCQEVYGVNTPPERLENFVSLRAKAATEIYFQELPKAEHNCVAYAHALKILFQGLEPKEEIENGETAYRPERQ